MHKRDQECVARASREIVDDPFGAHAKALRGSAPRGRRVGSFRIVYHVIPEKLS